MATPARCFGFAIFLIAYGCSGQRVAERSANQLLDQLNKKLAAFETAIDAAASAPAEQQEELVLDLHHRVGALEELLGDFHHQARNNAAVETPLRAISETVSAMRTVVESMPNESVPNVDRLRLHVRTLKSQIEELRPMLDKK